ncbi:hypothetical protein ISN44_As06g034560 [Arabidopsis suecica]|uniref:Uncharacterized protein n=1 Tax=Arabidopsis suecica TaxID=45249 RepID=A0A8T2CII4_ARASU|nr:hypothetical protein ISN44_As06g034560 [Arabidopsis suecica]
MRKGPKLRQPVGPTRATKTNEPRGEEPPDREEAPPDQEHIPPLPPNPPNQQEPFVQQEAFQPRMRDLVNRGRIQQEDIIRQGRGHMSRECPNQRAMIITQSGGYESQDDEEGNDMGEFLYADEGESLLTLRVLNTQPVLEGMAQRENLFHTRCTVRNKVCHLIIDSGSCTNIASAFMVNKLGLETYKHPHPYKLKWLNDKEELNVSTRVKLPFAIGNYKDLVTCDIVPMQAGHVLLGRPWQYDRGVNHNGRTNRYSFDYENRRITLAPLDQSEVRAMQARHKENNNNKVSFYTEKVVTPYLDDDMIRLSFVKRHEIDYTVSRSKLFQGGGYDADIKHVNGLAELFAEGLLERLPEGLAKGIAEGITEGLVDEQVLHSNNHQLSAGLKIQQQYENFMKNHRATYNIIEMKSSGSSLTVNNNVPTFSNTEAIERRLPFFNNVRVPWTLLFQLNLEDRREAEGFISCVESRHKKYRELLALHDDRRSELLHKLDLLESHPRDWVRNGFQRLAPMPDALLSYCNDCAQDASSALRERHPNIVADGDFIPRSPKMFYLGPSASNAELTESQDFVNQIGLMLQDQCRELQYFRTKKRKTTRALEVRSEDWEKIGLQLVWAMPYRLLRDNRSIIDRTI